MPSFSPTPPSPRPCGGAGSPARSSWRRDPRRGGRWRRSPTCSPRSSVALAHLLAEDRQPADDLRNRALVSSRLLEYETWTRINARGLTRSHGEALRALLARVAILELAGPVLQRAVDPFPVPVLVSRFVSLAQDGDHGIES